MVKTTLQIIETRASPIRQDELTALGLAQEGSTIPLPTAAFQRHRAYFEQHSQFSDIYKKRTIFENASIAVAVPLLTTLCVMMIPALSSAPVVVSLTALSALLAATRSKQIGHGIAKDGDRRLSIEKNRYEAEAKGRLNFLQSKAAHLAKERFLINADKAVQAGKTISMDQLAKLVNFEDEYIKDACDKLAITVLQAKLMIAIQDEKIAPIKIPHSRDAGSDAYIPDIYVAGALWMVFKRNIAPVKPQIILGASGKNEILSEDTEVCHSGLSITSLFSSYVEGIKGNLRIFQKPKADDHLSAIPTSITVSEFPAVTDLADRIQRNAQRLDFPALARE